MLLQFHHARVVQVGQRLPGQEGHLYCPFPAAHFSGCPCSNPQVVVVKVRAAAAARVCGSGVFGA